MEMVGTALDRPPTGGYLKALRFAELSLRAPLPARATMRRWRGELPDAFALSLRAPRSAIESEAGWLVPSTDLDEGVEWLLQAVEALRPTCVVIPTGAAITPGARSRDRLTAYAERLGGLGDCRCVWAPRGPWDPEQADAVAAKLGWARAFDPLQEPWSNGPLAYIELRALGQRQGFSQATLEDVHEQVVAAGADRTLIVVDGARGMREAQRLQQLFDDDER